MRDEEIEQKSSVEWGIANDFIFLRSTRNWCFIFPQPHFGKAVEYADHSCSSGLLLLALSSESVLNQKSSQAREIRQKQAPQLTGGNLEASPCVERQRMGSPIERLDGLTALPVKRSHIRNLMPSLPFFNLIRLARVVELN